MLEENIEDSKIRPKCIIYLDKMSIDDKKINSESIDSTHSLN